MKRGIDVSYANGSIDWNTVSKSGVDFAIIRSSFGSDLPSQIDSFFYQNANGCVKNGIPFGIYHFAYFIDENKARDEADFAIRLANEYKSKVKFIALDIEEDSERYAQRVGANPDWTKCAIAFLERIKATGYVPVLYSNQSWLQNKLDYKKLNTYKLWYAAPGASSPKYSCVLWQYSWSVKVNGIYGDVDMNYCYDESLFTVGKTDSNKTNANTQSGTSSKTESQNNNSETKKKSIDQLAKEVIAGKWGAGQEREDRLTKAGYNYNAVQKRVNEVLIPDTVTKKKSIDELAKEVIVGKWSAGDERKKKLTNAGYDYNAVQKRVNEVLSSKDNNKAYYIVKSGDTLTWIAKKFDTTVNELVKMNNIKDPDLIYVGMKLRVK